MRLVGRRHVVHPLPKVKAPQSVSVRSLEFRFLAHFGWEWNLPSAYSADLKETTTARPLSRRATVRQKRPQRAEIHVLLVFVASSSSWTSSQTDVDLELASFTVDKRAQTNERPSPPVEIESYAADVVSRRSFASSRSSATVHGEDGGKSQARRQTPPVMAPNRAPKS
jgi:hypothetical protein